MGISGIKTLYQIEDELQYYTKTGSLMPAEQLQNDDVIVSALSRKTQDGPGFENEDDLPESDFEGFSEADVETTQEDPK